MKKLKVNLMKRDIVNAHGMEVSILLRYQFLIIDLEKQDSVNENLRKMVFCRYQQ